MTGVTVPDLLGLAKDLHANQPLAGKELPDTDRDQPFLRGFRYKAKSYGK